MKLRESLNDLGWALKNQFTASPPTPPPPFDRSRSALKKLKGQALARRDELSERYDLSSWPLACWPEEIPEALWLLDLLDRQVVPRAPEGPCLDVGSKNWSYLPALRAAVPLEWTGVELDAHRRYMNLVTRRAVAERRARTVGESRYVTGALQGIRGEFGLITWLLPFVTPAPHDSWGLPRRFYDPPGMLRHAESLLRPGGLMLVVNMGEEEAVAQRKLFEDHGLAAAPLGEIRSAFAPYRKPRFGWLLEKPRGA